MTDTRDTLDVRDATDAKLIGRTIRDKYVVIRRLGEGGMGRVYLAELKEARARKFAVKLLRPELTGDASFRQRFHDEAQHQAQLDHENIVEMVDYFELKGDYYLVLDYVDGQTLSDMIDARQGKGLPEKQALAIITGVLNGLDCAHQKAIVHRDVKPSNVLVDARGRARITDFGIATDALRLTRTRDGQIVGTPEYMSPEQLSGSAAIDHRSDIFSAGVMLYQMLTGDMPFKGDSFPSIQAQQISNPVPNPRAVNPKIPKRLAEIVRRAMQKSPADRFQGGPQFIARIESYRRRGAWKYVMVSACLLAAAGIYVAQATVVNMHVVREAVHTAAVDYNILCREQGLKMKNQAGKGTADKAGESDLSETFRKNIARNEDNMRRGAREYGDVFEKMTHINQWTVRRALDEVDPAPAMEPVRRAVAADYDAYTAHGSRPTVESMLPRCQALGFEWKLQ
ncbi:serine/threonine protein kinase (plasmid) [Paraburkholderia caribensis MBA4]|uniref:non-specific serine/threonine protein kinase n=1 Tax=Paraburkholderia caribensis MBA4 TaxID=1323664 RepID=A0A0P0RPR5_9BURK|nr:serine/threonine-protein kinase [Paraburkholderia caribensis]ALL70960.1 serine/threonine protein kinase [Paraburkholderia caribensis MBA4]